MNIEQMDKRARMRRERTLWQRFMDWMNEGWL